MTDPAHHRRIRSFVRREGRLTDGQREALQRQWPVYGLEKPDKPLNLNEIFGREAHRVIEIGFGDGENLRHQLRSRPELDFIGIEVYRIGVGRLLRAAAEVNASNLRVCCHDAVEVLAEWLPPHCVDEVWLYFPDPWHKKRHHKRRLVQPPFCDLVARVLKSGGEFRLATDWEPYAQHMQEVLSGHGQFAASQNPITPEHRVTTRFQRRGERLGHGVWDFAYRRLPV